MTPEQLEIIDKINKGQPVQTIRTIENKKGVKRDIVTTHRFTYTMAKKKLVEIYGGSCCICGQWPDYKVLYDVEDAKRVERYCQKDYHKWKDRIKK